MAPEGCRFNVFLGHRRLSVIDLSAAGHQPMTDSEGCWLTFNGEIFNYIELREELRARGCQFRTATDSEVILQLYKEYGEAGFAKMNGMWAFALVDPSKGRAVLSRDRFSIKPLYLANIGHALYFSSEIKQLVPLLPSVQPNIEVMNVFLDQALLDHGSETFYRDICRLSPATNLVLDLKTGESTQAKYWDWSEPKRTQGDVVEQFRELLVDSIRIRLRSDVKVGVLLSGGLDSSSITMLTKIITGEVKTYSVISDSNCSEEAYADAVIEKVGCMGLKITTDAAQTLEALQRVLFHNDEPFGGLNVVAQYQMMQAIRGESDSTVLLSGQGADEVLLGYLKFFFFYLRELAKGAEFLKASAQVIGCIIHRTVLPQFRFDTARRYMPSARSRAFLRGIRDRVRLGRSADLRSLQIADIESYSIPALTHYEDRNAMAFGLEVRHPFLDHRLVEFAVGLPTSEKLNNGWSKYVLRRAVPELPNKVRWRRDKQGFPVPERLWLIKECGAMVEKLFRNSVLADIGVLDAPKFVECFLQFCAGSKRIGHSEITRVLIAELWARQFSSSSCYED
jgi:asparagine synthase (glutamine-hydrolysing)